MTLPEILLHRASALLTAQPRTAAEGEARRTQGLLIDEISRQCVHAGLMSRDAGEAVGAVVERIVQESADGEAKKELLDTKRTETVMRELQWEAVSGNGGSGGPQITQISADSAGVEDQMERRMNDEAPEMFRLIKAFLRWAMDYDLPFDHLPAWFNDYLCAEQCINRVEGRDQ